MSIDGIRAVDKEPLAAADYLFAMSIANGLRLGPRPIGMQAVSQQIASFLPLGNVRAYSSVAAMNADVTPAAGTLAYAEGKTWRKTAASGSSGWEVFLDFIPGAQLIYAAIVGGTANAIVAASASPVSTSDYRQLVAVGPFLTANTGSATITFNGGATLTFKTSGGSNLGAGALQPGMVVWGTKEGGNFRLLSDPATTAILTQVLAAQAAAELARDQAQASASSVQITEFATLAAAQAYAPISAPVYIRTAFRDTDQVARSGAKFKKNGTTSGDLVITLADGISQVGYSFAEDTLSATAMGMKPTNTAAANMAAFKAAVARTPTKGSLIVPIAGAVFNVDTSGGLSAAAVLDREMTIILRGDVKMNYAAYEDNPAYFAKVTGSNVIILGRGTIEGPGTIIVGPPSMTSTRIPGFIYVDNVAGFGWYQVKALRQPCTAIQLAGANCTLAKVKNADFVGGPDNFQFSVLRTDYTTVNPAYIGSAHFAILATGGGQHEFSSLNFMQDPTGGGRTINAIFTAGFYGPANYCSVKRCRAYKLWEKLLYGYGDGHTVSGNFGFGAYGTSDTEFIRLWGSNSRAYDNYTELWRSAMQVLDGNRNKVYGNTFLRLRSNGINVQDFTVGYGSGIDFNQVYDNHLTWDAAAPEKRFAIRFTNIKLDGTTVVNDITGAVVKGNTVEGFGNAGSGTQELEYAIEMTSKSPYNAVNCKITDNNLANCPNGIVLRRHVGSVVSRNDFKAGTYLAINLVGGANQMVSFNTGSSPGAYHLSIDAADPPSGTSFLFNYCTGAGNIAIRNHTTFGANNIHTEGNRWTSAPLVFAFQLVNAVTTTVTHGGVAPHAQFDWPAPRNDPFAALLANPGLRASRNGANFDVRMVNGIAAAGGEQGNIIILQ